LPPVTQSLIVANVAGFLLERMLGGRMIEWFALWPGAGPAALPLETPWQLVTYAFLHANLAHLAFNLFGLWMFGSDLERVWGGRRFFACFLCSVLAGGATQLAAGSMFGTGYGPVLGASGGVFGLLLAFAICFPRRQVMLLFPPIPMPAPLFVLVYALLELALGVTGTQAGVAHFAHLGGMLGGFLSLQFFRGRFPFGRR